MNIFNRRIPNYSNQRTGRGKFKILPLVVFGFFVLYYISSNQETVPVTGRTHLVDMSRSQEAALGLNSYREILANSKVIKSGPELQRIKAIGQKIAAVSGAKDFNWEFNLIDSEQANAFCLPGGKVAVYTGILPIAKNDAGLATIIGHEVAHAIARHGAERIAHQKLAQYGQIAVNMSTSEMSPGSRQAIRAAFGVGSQFGILLPYSRKHESEADLIGLTFLAKACFDPREAPLLWERMQANEKSSVPELLSTHPASNTRIKQFREWLPEAISIYNQECA